MTSLPKLDAEGSIKASPSPLQKATRWSRFMVRIAGLYFASASHLLRLRLTAIRHNFTYKLVDSPKQIVVIGGSFAGINVAKWLADAVPTGYQVVLIEKNSHFNYLFAFPRYSVVKGHEDGAFIPYSEILGSALKKGSIRIVQGEVTQVDEKHVVLRNGEKIEHECLVLATGTSQLPPAKWSSAEKNEACKEIRDTQDAISKAQSIAVLGSGAVGVEIAADIKSYFPSKSVTLYSSRDTVMPNFGTTLRDHVTSSLGKVGVHIRYNVRPTASSDRTRVEYPDGTTENFDLVLSCTGQQPNCSLLTDHFSDAISKSTGRVLVTPTLQVKLSADESSVVAPTTTKLFALGDVAEHGGPRMARAVYMQAAVVRDNVLECIRGKVPARTYKPNFWMEGSIQVTVGKDESVGYMPSEDGNDVLLIGAGYPEDFRIAQGWRLVGAKYTAKRAE